MKIGDEVEVHVASQHGAVWVPGRVVLVHPVDKTHDVERYTVVPSTPTMLLAACHPDSLRSAA